MWPFLKAIFDALTAGFNFGSKVAPTDKMKEQKQDAAMPRIESHEMIRIYDREYRRLKDHEEIDIATDVNLIDDKMPDDQKAELIKNLTDRIFKYREEHPIRFKKWLQTNVYKNWKEQQEKK